jgi:predicted amidohydrolase YtcJ
MALLLGNAAAAQQAGSIPQEVLAYPQMIVHNAKLVTMDDHSFGLNTPVGTIAQAMAIRDGKILEVGSNDQILRLKGPQTAMIDARGRMVMPGYIDTHTHIHNGALTRWVAEHPEAEAENATSYSVSGRTPEELRDAITAAVREHVRSAEPGRWAFISISGGQGMVGGILYLANKNYTMEMLDQYSPQHPVVLFAHPSYIVNTAFTKGMEQIYGKFDADAAGLDEWGRIKSTAAQYRREIFTDLYFRSRVPKLAEITEEGLMLNAAAGITTYVSHIMGERFMDAFNMLARQNRMPVRFGYTHWFGFAAGYADSEIFYKKMGDFFGHGLTDYFWQAGVGLGAIDSGPPRFCSTMEAPPAIKELEWCQNGPGTREYETTKTLIANYQRVQVGHAFADKGVDFFMDAVEEAMKENPAITLDYIRNLRLTSDHCGFYPRISQIPRLAHLGIIISCGANVLTRSAPWIGPGRFAPKYEEQIAPIRSAIAGGVMVTFESEAGIDVEGSRSYFGHAIPFLTRKNARGQVVGANEAIDKNTLLKMMTNWAAKFIMKEDVLGSLEKGKWADFIVLSNDYFAGPPEALYGVYPEMTVIAGNIKVLREDFARELGKQPVGPQIRWTDEEPPPAPPE